MTANSFIGHASYVLVFGLNSYCRKSGEVVKHWVVTKEEINKGNHKIMCVIWGYYICHSNLSLLSYLPTNSSNKDAQEILSLPSFFCTTSIFILFYHYIRQSRTHQVDQYYISWKDWAQREYFNRLILAFKSSNVFSGISYAASKAIHYSLRW